MRLGFTLVEIVVSIGLMGIAFLATAAGISSLMVRQNVTYQNTVGASAASLLFAPDRFGNTPTIAELTASDSLLSRVSLKAEWCIYRNGPSLADTYNASVNGGRWEFYRFNPDTAFGGLLDLRAYRSLIIALHSPQTTVEEQLIYCYWDDMSGTKGKFPTSTQLARIFPHFDFGEKDSDGNTGAPETPKLHFSQAIMWLASRDDAEVIAQHHAAGKQLPLNLDYLGSYRFLHQQVSPFSPDP
jgi:hypothetical protein